MASDFLMGRRGHGNDDGLRPGPLQDNGQIAPAQDVSFDAFQSKVGVDYPYKVPGFPSGQGVEMMVAHASRTDDH